MYFWHSLKKQNTIQACGESAGQGPKMFRTIKVLEDFIKLNSSMKIFSLKWILPQRKMGILFKIHNYASELQYWTNGTYQWYGWCWAGFHFILQVLVHAAQVTNSGCVYWQNYSLRFHIASCVNWLVVVWLCVITRSDTDVHTVASLLKLYLRELPEPVVPWTQYQDFLDCTNLLDSTSKEVTSTVSAAVHTCIRLEEGAPVMCLCVCVCHLLLRVGKCWRNRSLCSPK